MIGHKLLSSKRFLLNFAEFYVPSARENFILMIL